MELRLKWQFCYKKVFSGDKPCENAFVIQRFGDYLCFHHRGWCSRLGINPDDGAEVVSETLGYNVALTRLMAREHFFAVSHLRTNIAYFTEQTSNVTWFVAYHLLLRNVGSYVTIYMNVRVITVDTVWWSFAVKAFWALNRFPSDSAVKGVGLRPLGCWDRGFESGSGHDCLSHIYMLCCPM
jgi:hypothetical protein